MRIWIKHICLIVTLCASHSALAISCQEIEDARKEIRWNTDHIGQAQAAINELTARKDETELRRDEVSARLKTLEDAAAEFGTTGGRLYALIISKYQLDQVLNNDQQTRQILADVMESEARASQDAPQLSTIMADLKDHRARSDVSEYLSEYLSGLQKLDAEPHSVQDKYFEKALAILRMPQSPESQLSSQLLTRLMKDLYAQILRDGQFFRG